MKLSTKSRYGVRILVQMALDSLSGNTPSRGRKIAEQQGITEGYLEQIMIPFRHNEVVEAVRGCHGGYTLKKSPKEITLLEIIELFEGEIKLAGCNGRKGECKRIPECPTTGVWQELETTFREKAGSITLDYILQNYCEGLSPDYII